MTIHVKWGSITDPNSKYSVIVNASNAHGVMGAGIAGAIARAGGPAVQAEAQLYCRGLSPVPGMVFRTGGGDLRCTVFHAITMYNMGTSYRNDIETGLGIVRKCSNGIFRQFKVDDNHIYADNLMDVYHSIAVPALATGIGGLPTLEVARIMMKSAIDHGFLKSKQKVVFCDIDEQFIVDCKRAFVELTK